MGGLLSTAVTTTYPASSATLCVLPLKTNGESHFSIAPGPMPQQLSQRLAEVEYHGIVAGVNSVLQTFSGFSVLALLLPFVVFDSAVLIALILFDPSLILAPWDYGMLELLLPLGLEFGVIFGSFPLVAHLLSMRMTAVQTKVAELLDDSSRRFGARGLHFALKQGVLHNGAGTNLWVEVQVVPIVHVQAPVPVPVPTLSPIVLPAAPQTSWPAAPATPAAAATAAATAAPAAADASAAAGAPAARSAAGGAGVSVRAPPDPNAHAPTIGGMSAEGAATFARDAASRGVSLSAVEVEYLRVLQENQLLRQCLSQHQALIQHLAQQTQTQNQHQRPRTEPVASASA